MLLQYNFGYGSYKNINVDFSYDIYKEHSLSIENISSFNFKIILNNEQTKNSLTSIILGTNISSLNINLNDSPNLKSISLPNINILDNNALENCYSLVSVDIPKLKTIGIASFYNCKSISSLYFPNLTDIDSASFNNCINLISVDFPKLTSFGNYVLMKPGPFYNCQNLSYVNLPLLRHIKSDSFPYTYKLKELYLPSLNTIGMYAFEHALIKKLILPKLTNISQYAFYLCYTLSCLDIADTTTKVDIGSGALHINNDKTLLYVPVNRYLEYINDSALTSVSKNKPIILSKAEVTNTSNIIYKYDLDQISSKVQYVNKDNWTTGQIEQPYSSDSFSTNNIKSYKIRGNVISSIGDYSFANCENLKEVDFSDILSVGNYAFAFDIALSNLDIHNSLSICTQAFDYCEKLISIDISNVKYIGDYAFLKCKNLSTIILSNQINPPIIENGTWLSTPTNKTFWVNDSAYLKYLADTNWLQYTSNISSITLPKVSFYSDNLICSIAIVNYNTSATPPIVEKDHHTLEGWINSYNNVTVDISCYAIWKQYQDIVDENNNIFVTDNNMVLISQN